ncbi:PBCV-specific basic adaptor domain-containing protein [Paramecium bursaria Chlorella virus CviKI]|nr:PBCV-specific basic adaptor domain-containing protein [Paramecium bursaria Chlorella virus CviKI]
MSTTPERQIAYALSPEPPGRAESHRIPKTLRPMKNLRISEANKISKVVSTDIKFTPSKFGKKIGGGVYGSAYSAKVTASLMEQIKIGLNNGGGKVFKELPKAGSSVIIKVAKQKSDMSDEVFFKESARENVVHKELSVGHCYKIPDASKGTCISEYVPNFYLSYIIGTSKKHVCVTFMDFAGEMTATGYFRYLRKTKPGRDFYARYYVYFEKVICSLWLAGYVHGDLHRDNIMVNKNGEVKLIDFGFALKLPEPFVKGIANGITKMIKERNPRSFADLWTKETVNGIRIVNYTNRVVKGRGFSWYNPDYKVLQTFYNEVPVEQRSLIPMLRSQMWGVRSQPGRKMAPEERNVKFYRKISKSPGSPIKRLFETSPNSSLESGEIRGTPAKKWVPKNGRYWANEPTPSEYKSPTPVSRRSPTPVSRKEPTPPTEKRKFKRRIRYRDADDYVKTRGEIDSKKLTPPTEVDAKKRKVFRNAKDRTHVYDNNYKKVYVKKVFSPKAPTPKDPTPATAELEKVNAKGRRVFRDTKGRTFVKQDGKKVYVKKLFTPKKSGATLPESKAPAPAGSPVVNTGKVDAKKRKVFKNSKGRTHVRQDGKKVYVKKLFTPKAV